MQILVIRVFAFSCCFMLSSLCLAQPLPEPQPRAQPVPQAQPTPGQSPASPPAHTAPPSYPEQGAPAAAPPAAAPSYPAPPFPESPPPGQNGLQPYSPPVAQALPPAAPHLNLPYQGPVVGSNPKYFNRTTFELEAELEETGTGAPIAFLVIGVPALAFGGGWLARSIIRYDECRQDYRYSGSDGNYYYEDERKRPCQTRQVLGIIGGSLAIVVGLPFTTVGTILLPLRLAKRGRLTREIELRRKYSGQGPVSFQHSLAPTAGAGLAYVLSGRF